jgi:hypothetical protein
MRGILRLSVVAGIIVSSTSGSIGAQQPASAIRASGPLADSLRTFSRRMVRLLQDRDARGAIALYGDPPHFVHVENGVVIPWTQLSAMMTSYLDTASANPVSLIGEPGVTLIDRNNAVIYATHRFEASNGRAAHDGVWTGVVHRFPSGWKVVHSHSSDRR